MRKFLIALWLMIPVAALAYHYGPGQDRMQYDRIANLITKAEASAKRESWSEASQIYDQALALVPKSDLATAQSLRLERAKVWMFDSKLPQAHDELETLVRELKQQSNSESKSNAVRDEKLLNNARAALANSKYYLTWLMRLEGQPKEKWEPVIDSARQHYRLLAENESGKAGEEARKDLEASIRLARLDLGELQGLPLPSQ